MAHTLKDLPTSKEFQDFHKSSGPQMQKLAEDPGGSINRKKIEATQRFNEFAWRLDQRYMALQTVEQAMFFEPDKMIYTTHDVQHEFVNRIEGYFQQLYAATSALVLYLSFVAPHSFRRSMPISNIKQFLEFLIQKPEIDLKEEIKLLEKSRDFRARFIDHIQQHILHDWETGSRMLDDGRNVCTVIYFIKKGPEVYFRGVFDPYAPDFEPSSNYESFYVSPPHEKCHAAYFKLCQTLIGLISAQE